MLKESSSATIQTDPSNALIEGDRGGFQPSSSRDQPVSGESSKPGTLFNWDIWLGFLDWG